MSEETKKTESKVTKKGNFDFITIKQTPAGYQVFSKQNGKTFLIGVYQTEQEALKAKSEYTK